LKVTLPNATEPSLDEYELSHFWRLLNYPIR
jgi:hypothetical protein